MTLIIGDTSADYFCYPYEPETGTVGTRSVFGDTSGRAGSPDGVTLDAEGGLWCALVVIDGLDVRGRPELRFTLSATIP